MTSSIRNYMYVEDNVKCLYPNEDAAAKVAGYKKLEKKEHYKINQDFFQLSRRNDDFTPKDGSGFIAPGTSCPTYTEEVVIPKVEYLMTMFTFGTPINSPKEAEVDKDLSDIDPKRKFPSDLDYVFTYIRDVKEMIKEKYPEGDTDFVARIDTLAMLMDNMMKVVEKDGSMVMFSILFVWAFITYHTQSCMLSSLAMAIVLLSFPFTAFITNMIFQVKYFGFL